MNFTSLNIMIYIYLRTAESYHLYPVKLICTKRSVQGHITFGSKKAEEFFLFLNCLSESERRMKIESAVL